MNENKEFKPYIPAEKVTPEFTITSIVMGILLQLCSVQQTLTSDYVLV